MEAIKDALQSKEKKEKKRIINRAWIVILVLVVIVGIGVTSLAAYGKSVQHTVLPGVHIGDVPVGGMDEAALTDFLEVMSNKLANDGIELTFLHEEGTVEELTLFPAVLPDDNIYELLRIETEKEVQRLLSYGKRGGSVVTGISAILSRTQSPQRILQYVTLDRAQLESQVREQIGQYEREARDAKIHIIDATGDPVTYNIASSTTGLTIDFDTLEAELLADWSHLVFPKRDIAVMKTYPNVTEEAVAQVTDRISAMVDDGGLTLTYTDPHTERVQTWDLDLDDIGSYLTVYHDESTDAYTIGLHKEDITTYLKEVVEPKVNVEPVEAKFEVGEDGKVSAFRGSRPGVALDVEATFTALNETFTQRYGNDEGIVSTVPLITAVAEPEVKTGEVNDLGITELLGTGYSNFSGSPPNRVRNVRFAVDEKLNGLLIKPDDTFSLLEALKPFTIEGGYLPELVIKGDEIIPEVGGGLCQVGSTMFRAAMNSGLPITERRNHSLVVGYYNDHRNGLPGTDATIYDAAPDFKFHNDTGNYLLLTTQMNESTGDLWFSLWGTGDGRSGYYTEPVVHEWIPAGEPRITLTTELEPGVEKCQSAHPGAVTSFRYVVENENGETEERVFRSHYRALPKICLVGATQEEIDAEEAGGSASAQDTEATDASAEEAGSTDETESGSTEPISEESSPIETSGEG